MTTTSLKLQSLIVICVCLYARFSHGFPCSGSARSSDEATGVKIITYGEPCHTPRYLPIRIEEPVQPLSVEGCATTRPYQQLKLNYQTTNVVSQPAYTRGVYPFSIEVPRVTPVETPCAPDVLRGKSYTYSTQTRPSLPTPMRSNYNFNIHVLPPLPETTTPPQRPVKLLTGLTSRIDRIVIPACNNKPSCSCKGYIA